MSESIFSINENIDQITINLINKNFLNKDIEQFENLVISFLNSKNLLGLNIIINRVLLISRENYGTTFSKFAALFAKIDNLQLNEAIVTALLRNENSGINNICIFTKELLKANKDISFIENEMLTNYHNIDNIFIFLKNINKNKLYFVKFLIDNKKFYLLNAYIDSLIKEDDKKDIINIIINEFPFQYKIEYCDTVVLILNKTNEFSKELIYNSVFGDISLEIQTTLLNSIINSVSFIDTASVNYFEFMFNHDVIKARHFEDLVIKHSKPYQLYWFAKDSINADKKSMLLSIIKANKDGIYNNLLLKFIKEHPKYEKLIPFL